MSAEPSEDGGVLMTPPVVSALLREQFPQWAGRAVTRVEPGGWDHRMFRLGEDLLARLPSRARYVPQVAKEQRWLPFLAPRLPLAIPVPVGLGKPGCGYPWPWSVYRWLEGAPASRSASATDEALARALVEFLHALSRMDASGGPAAGEHNFFRGGAVGTYDGQVREAIAALGARIDPARATRVWQEALAAPWAGPAVWVHGDVAPGNLLTVGGRLVAVIDFGSCGVGDPACDLTMAWTFFEGRARRVFREALGLDAGTWMRARGWALWKALILMRGAAGAASAAADAPRVLGEVLGDAIELG
jgi:aminoglycoside phosphotransferase (APT) family kinase protein